MDVLPTPRPAWCSLPSATPLWGSRDDTSADAGLASTAWLLELVGGS